MGCSLWYLRTNAATCSESGAVPLLDALHPCCPRAPRRRRRRARRLRSCQPLARPAGVGSGCGCDGEVRRAGLCPCRGCPVMISPSAPAASSRRSASRRTGQIPRKLCAGLSFPCRGTSYISHGQFGSRAKECSTSRALCGVVPATMRGKREKGKSAITHYGEILYAQRC